MLLIDNVPVTCINQAALQFQVPAVLIAAVLTTEGGKPGMTTPNTNGSFDYGPMQINTVWLNSLQHFGYTAEQIRDDACINVWLGTWILSQEIANSRDFWQGVGNYNSHHLTQNYYYQRRVVKNYYDLLYYLTSK